MFESRVNLMQLHFQIFKRTHEESLDILLDTLLKIMLAI